MNIGQPSPCVAQSDIENYVDQQFVLDISSEELIQNIVRLSTVRWTVARDDRRFEIRRKPFLPWNRTKVILEVDEMRYDQPICHLFIPSSQPKNVLATVSAAMSIGEIKRALTTSDSVALTYGYLR